MTVRAPALANATAVASPIPEFPPVTITVLPVMDPPSVPVVSLMVSIRPVVDPLTSGIVTGTHPRTRG
jgi:hypothetical protein